LLDKIQIKYPYSRFANQGFNGWLHVIATDCFKLFSNQRPVNNPLKENDLPAPYSPASPGYDGYVMDRDFAEEFWEKWAGRGAQLVLAVDQDGNSITELTDENVDPVAKTFDLPLSPQIKYFLAYFTPVPYEDPETGFFAFDSVVFYRERVKIEKPSLCPVDFVYKKDNGNLRLKAPGSSQSNWDYEITEEITDGNPEYYLNLNPFSDKNIIGKPVNRILVYKPMKDTRSADPQVSYTDIGAGYYWDYHIPRHALVGTPEKGWLSDGSIRFNSPGDVFEYPFTDFLCFDSSGNLVSKDLLEIDVPGKAIGWHGVSNPEEFWFYHFTPGFMEEGETTFTEKETFIGPERSKFKESVIYFRQSGELSEHLPQTPATGRVTPETMIRYGCRRGNYYIEVDDSLINVPLKTVTFKQPQIYTSQLLRVGEPQDWVPTPDSWSFSVDLAKVSNFTANYTFTARKNGTVLSNGTRVDIQAYEVFDDGSEQPIPTDFEDTTQGHAAHGAGLIVAVNGGDGTIIHTPIPDHLVIGAAGKSVINRMMGQPDGRFESPSPEDPGLVKYVIKASVDGEPIGEVELVPWRYTCSAPDSLERFELVPSRTNLVFDKPQAITFRVYDSFAESYVTNTDVEYEGDSQLHYSVGTGNRLNAAGEFTETLTPDSQYKSQGMESFTVMLSKDSYMYSDGHCFSDYISCMFSLSDTIEITTESLAAAQTNETYETSIEVVGTAVDGDNPAEIWFEHNISSSVLSGVDQDKADLGIFNGVFLAEGVYEVTFHARDKNGNEASKTFTISAVTTEAGWSFTVDFNKVSRYNADYTFTVLYNDEPPEAGTVVAIKAYEIFKDGSEVLVPTDFEINAFQDYIYHGAGLVIGINDFFGIYLAECPIPEYKITNDSGQFVIENMLGSGNEKFKNGTEENEAFEKYVIKGYIDDVHIGDVELFPWTYDCMSNYEFLTERFELVPSDSGLVFDIPKKVTFRVYDKFKETYLVNSQVSYLYAGDTTYLFSLRDSFEFGPYDTRDINANGEFEERLRFNSVYNESSEPMLVKEYRVMVWDDSIMHFDNQCDNKHAICEFTISDGIQITTESLDKAYTNYNYEATIEVYGTNINANNPAEIWFEHSIDPSVLVNVDQAKASAGVFNGTFLADGEYEVTFYAKDGDGFATSKTFTITATSVIDTLEITTQSISKCYAGTSFSYKIEAAGGVKPHTWGMLASGSLPPNTSIDPTTGVITGNISTVGDYVFSVEVSSVDGQQAEKEYTLPIVVYNAPTGVQITTESIDWAYAGESFSFTFEAVGEDPDFLTWGISYDETSWASVLKNITFDKKTGTLSGIFDEFENDYTSGYQIEILVTVTTSNGLTDSEYFTLYELRRLTITTGSPLKKAGINIPYSTTINAIGGLGVKQWSIVSGALPDEFDKDLSQYEGRYYIYLEGTPQTEGTYQFTVRVTSGDDGGVCDKAFVLVVGETTLEITTQQSSIPDTYEGSDQYEYFWGWPWRAPAFYFDARGGNIIENSWGVVDASNYPADGPKPYTWEIVDGNEIFDYVFFETNQLILKDEINYSQSEYTEDVWSGRAYFYGTINLDAATINTRFPQYEDAAYVPLEFTIRVTDPDEKHDEKSFSFKCYLNPIIETDASSSSNKLAVKMYKNESTNFSVYKGIKPYRFGIHHIQDSGTFTDASVATTNDPNQYILKFKPTSRTASGKIGIYAYSQDMPIGNVTTAYYNEYPEPGNNYRLGQGRIYYDAEWTTQLHILGSFDSPGHLGATYSKEFTITGGFPEYIVRGVIGLPPGIVWSRPQPNTILLSGIPTTIGAYPVTFSIEDSEENTYREEKEFIVVDKMYPEISKTWSWRINSQLIIPNDMYRWAERRSSSNMQVSPLNYDNYETFYEILYPATTYRDPNSSSDSVYLGTPAKNPDLRAKIYSPVTMNFKFKATYFDLTSVENEYNFAFDPGDSVGELTIFRIFGFFDGMNSVPTNSETGLTMYFYICWNEDTPDIAEKIVPEPTGWFFKYVAVSYAEPTPLNLDLDITVT
jgi:hypothetical protein